MTSTTEQAYGFAEVCAALSDRFGTRFELENTGGKLGLAAGSGCRSAHLRVSSATTTKPDRADNAAEALASGRN